MEPGSIAHRAFQKTKNRATGGSRMHGCRA